MSTAFTTHPGHEITEADEKSTPSATIMDAAFALELDLQGIDVATT